MRHRWFRSVGAAVAVLAAAVLLAGCTDDDPVQPLDEDDDPVLPLDETVEDTDGDGADSGDDGDAADGDDVDPVDLGDAADELSAGQVEFDAEQQAVIDDYEAFIETINGYDLGEAGLDAALATLTDDLADEFEDVWEPTGHDEGRRLPNVTNVEIDGDAARLIDCLEDERLLDEELAGGDDVVWRSAYAELEREDGDWKVARFTDFESPSLVPCLPPQVETEVVNIYLEFVQERADALSESAAPEHDTSTLEPLTTTPMLDDTDEFNTWYRDNDGHTAIVQDMNAEVRDVNADGEVLLVTCTVSERWDAIDTFSGEVIEDTAEDGMQVHDITMVRHDDDTWRVAASRSASHSGGCDEDDLPHRIDNTG